MRRLICALAVAGGLTFVPAALGQEPPAPPPPAEPPRAVTEPAPPPAPADPAPAPAPEPKPRLSLRVEGVRTVGGRRRGALAARLVARASVRPQVGRELTFRVFREGRRIALRGVSPRRVSGLDAGVARFGFTPSRAGRYRVEVLDPLTGASESARFSVTYPSVSAGDRGPGVRLLQRLLARRHFAVPRSGVFDAGTARAVLAFRKVHGLRRNSAVDRGIWRRLGNGGAFRLRYPDAGKHVEVDRSRQVMALVSSRDRYRVYHVSTGAPATPTILGRFRFYRKQPGTNAKGMIHSAYFIRGYATHGYMSVPTYPASHGCVRIPPPNARTVYNWIRLGDRIDVYR